MDHKKLQDLSENELTLLCQEIREQLIDQMSRNGGFLADNLSAVDIVVYLNQTFENHVELLYSSERISFAQKYLENQGRSVSCHENVTLAQAMGIAAGLKAQNKDIPIVYLMTDEDIVDFNIIKQLDSADLKMTIIYLDRQDKDVNALNKLVNDLRQTDVYTGLKKGVKKSLSKVRSSEQIITGIHKIKDSLKKTLIDEDIFSKCNVDYLGPIDGHAPNQLKKAFQNIRKNRRLVVLHCLVKTGKGYACAEKDETLADRTLPFNRKDGRSFASENDKNLKPYTIINRTIQKIMEENESVFCIGNGSFASNGMANVFAAYPERCLKVKLDEEELLKLLKGMMETGMIPVAAIDPEVLDKYPIQLNELALLGKGLLLYTKEEENLPCRSLNDLQDLYLIQPKDGNELQKAVYTAIDINKPVIIITQPQCLAYEESPKTLIEDLGKWHFLVNNEISKAVILGRGNELDKIRDIIVSNDLKCDLIDMACLNKVDPDCITSLKKKYKHIYFYGKDQLIKEYLPETEIIDGDIDVLFARIKKELDA